MSALSVIEVELAVKEAASRLNISLKPEQKEVLMEFVCGNDVFVCLPTGYGKSLCYMLLPVVHDLLRGHHNSSLILVISPLRSLMMDQVNACSKLGLNAVRVCSEVRENVREGSLMNADYQVLFISPELILTKRSWRDVLLNECYQSKLVGLIIDEAHCVKSWGEEFRPEFKRIGDLRSVVPKNVNVMALTATATISSRLSIERTLGMKNPTVIEISPEKSNIYLSTELFESIDDSFKPLVDDLLLNGKSSKRTIIFCKKRDDCAKLYSYFKFYLGKGFTYPPGENERLPKNRLVDMFCSGTQPEVKEEMKHHGAWTRPLTFT